MNRLVRLAACLVVLTACTPPASSPPVVPDATPDGSCSVSDKINAYRLIGQPDGAALWIFCDAGAPTITTITILEGGAP